jgi:Peptidase M15
LLWPMASLLPADGGKRASERDLQNHTKTLDFVQAESAIGNPRFARLRSAGFTRVFVQPGKGRSAHHHDHAPHGLSAVCTPSRNAAVGGARHSYHLSGSATDFSIDGDARAVHAYLSSNRSLGGLKHYGGNLFHIDVGPRRTREPSVNGSDAFVTAGTLSGETTLWGMSSEETC